MPTPSMPEMGNLNSFKEVTNQLIEIQDYIQWLLKNLNHLNVKQLFTEYCKIQSAAGETVINGPTIQMYDKQATPKLRLKQGYDPVTGDFVYQMYDKTGVQTVGIDSNGKAVYSGSVIIGTGNNVFGADGTNGIWLGNAAFGLAPFSVSLAGALTATGATIANGTITGGTIQTAATGRRLVLTGSALSSMNSVTNDGFTLDGVDGFLRWYTAGVLKGLIGKDTSQGPEQMYISHAYILLAANSSISLASSSITIGQNLGNVYAAGTWNFGGATTVTGLVNSTVADHSHTVTVSGTVYTTTSAGGHTHTIT